MYVIGLDVGTTGCKALVVNERGEIAGYGFKEYGIDSGPDGRAEQDAEQVWKKVLHVIQKACTEVDRKAVKALSISTQGDAIIATDDGFLPIYPAVLGMDYRSAPQMNAFCQTMDARQLFTITGMRPHPMNSLCKILWLKDQRPDIYKKATHIMTYADYILSRFGSEPSIDFTMASRTMAFSLREGRWSSTILNNAEIDRSLLSKPVPSGAPVGNISPRIAEELGFPKDTLLIAGGHDQTCAALGTGMTSEGVGLISTGTAEVLSTVLHSANTSDALYEGFFPCYRYVIPDRYFTFSLNHVGGLLLRWFRDNFAQVDAADAARTGSSVFALIDERMPKEPSQLLFLPHLNGSGTPTCDLNAKGAIVGLTMDTSRYDIARSILECQSYELRINLEYMGKAGVTVAEINATGGGARSSLWLQIKADILGYPVKRLVNTEAACFGAAALAAIGSGLHQEAKTFLAHTLQAAETFEPRARVSQIYNDNFQTYKNLYPALKPIHDGLQAQP